MSFVGILTKVVKSRRLSQSLYGMIPAPPTHVWSTFPTEPAGACSTPGRSSGTILSKLKAHSATCHPECQRRLCPTASTQPVNPHGSASPLSQFNCALSRSGSTQVRGFNACSSVSGGILTLLSRSCNGASQFCATIAFAGV